MEAEALQGAAETIRRHRPTLYGKNERDGKSAALITLLLSYTYRLYWHAPFMFRPDNFAGDRETLSGAPRHNNMLCVPREATGGITGLTEISGPHDNWHRARPI